MIPILDNGHGGMINNIYQTKGKQSPKWAKGILYEGVFNRLIVNGICEELKKLDIPFYKLVPEQTDISLTERVKRTNIFYNNQKDSYLISVHANAAPTNNTGKGLEIFTSKGETKSDAIASLFINMLWNSEIGMEVRTDYSDNDADKESDFYILKYTNCPAILIEYGFMNHKEDYNKLMDNEWINKAIKYTVKGIETLYRLKK